MVTLKYELWNYTCDQKDFSYTDHFRGMGLSTKQPLLCELFMYYVAKTTQMTVLASRFLPKTTLFVCLISSRELKVLATVN